jgi:anthranilate phosphoribosyltransferase
LDVDIPIRNNTESAHSSQSGLPQILHDAGAVFLFAQKFHPAMRRIAHVRHQLGIKTIFNLLGPLINPAKPNHMVLGVYEQQLGPIFANTLLELGHVQTAMVVCGDEGLDEVNY